MTKKHFIELADHIKFTQHELKWTDKQIHSLSDFCTLQNPRFKRDRWLGYIAGTNGKNGGKVRKEAP